MFIVYFWFLNDTNIGLSVEMIQEVETNTNLSTHKHVFIMFITKNMLLETV